MDGQRERRRGEHHGESGELEPPEGAVLLLRERRREARRPVAVQRVGLIRTVHRIRDDDGDDHDPKRDKPIAENDERNKTITKKVKQDK